MRAHPDPLSVGALDARPAGLAARPRRPSPPRPATFPVQGARPAPDHGVGGVATRPRSETVAITLPPPPLEGRVVADGAGGRRRRRWWPAVVASALIAGLHGVVLPARARRHGHRPSVQGRTQAEAVSAVRNAALDPTVSETFSEKVPKGVVISADPGPGSNVGRGSDVALVVSKGPERHAVPPVVGMTLAEASERIREVNLKVGKVTKAYNEKVPEGQVVAAKPGPRRA